MINLEKSQGKYRFSVTDTIAIDFSEAIDTAGLAIAVSPQEGLQHRFQGRDRLLIFGTAKTSGTPHFNIDSPFSLTLAGLKDLAGNGRGEISESFAPYAWADRDFIDTTFNSYDSLFTPDSMWVDGTPLTDTIVTEGWLNFNNNFGKEDRQDFKIVRMVPPDTLKLSLACSKSLNLRMQIAGPFPEKGLDSALADFSFTDSSFYSDSTRTRGILASQFTADFTTHFHVFHDSQKAGIYAVRLSIPENTKGFYRLGLRVLRGKP